jgi:hypothetical protein
VCPFALRQWNYVEDLRQSGMVINQRLQAGIAITLLEPDPLARNNILSFFPRIFLQGLVVITVGTEPQRNPVPLAIRFRKRDWHIGDSPFAGVLR